MEQEEEPKKPYKSLEERVGTLGTTYLLRGADPEDPKTLDSTLQVWNTINPDTPLKEEKLRTSWDLRRAIDGLTSDARSQVLNYFTIPEHGAEGLDYAVEKIKDENLFIDALASVYRNRDLEKAFEDTKGEPEKIKEVFEKTPTKDRLLYDYARIKQAQKMLETGELDEKGYKSVAISDLGLRAMLEKRKCLEAFSHYIRTPEDVKEYLDARLAILRAQIKLAFGEDIPTEEKGKTKKVFDRDKLRKYIEGVIESEYEDKEKPVVYSKIAGYGAGFDIEDEEIKYRKRQKEKGYKPLPEFKAREE